VKIPALKPNYNLSPTQETPIVRVGSEGARKIDLVRWQLVPPWEPEFKTKLSTINAKSETIFESRLYKGLILRRRCIVPLSGFFEWKRDGEKKRPFAIHLKGEPIMSIAGVWDTWKHGETAKDSFAILTTASNEFMNEIHNRMPLILSREDEEAWLDPALNDRARVESILNKSLPSEKLDAYEVSTRVNSPRNTDADVISPLRKEEEAAPPQLDLALGLEPSARPKKKSRA
jgi:putative SOS response-associated peptidase YedK